jgi:hypothetical protein
MLVLVIIIFFESLRKMWEFWKIGLQNIPETEPVDVGPASDLNITIQD